ncbi:MAG: PQQ-binding-like beta-propeller repeat protein [Planctomycetota bacterium]
MTRVAEGRVVHPRKLRPDCPRWLAAVIARALAVDPAERYPDGAALAAALVPPTPAAAPRILAAAAPLALLALGLAAWVVHSRAAPVESTPAVEVPSPPTPEASVSLESIPEPLRALAAPDASPRLVAVWGDARDAGPILALAADGDGALSVDARGLRRWGELPEGLVLATPRGAQRFSAAALEPGSDRALTSSDALRGWSLSEAADLVEISLESPSVAVALAEGGFQGAVALNTTLFVFRWASACAPTPSASRAAPGPGHRPRPQPHPGRALGQPAAGLPTQPRRRPRPAPRRRGRGRGLRRARPAAADPGRHRHGPARELGAAHGGGDAAGGGRRPPGAGGGHGPDPRRAAPGDRAPERRPGPARGARRDLARAGAGAPALERRAADRGRPRAPGRAPLPGHLPRGGARLRARGPDPPAPHPRALDPAGSGRRDPRAAERDPRGALGLRRRAAQRQRGRLGPGLGPRDRRPDPRVPRGAPAQRRGGPRGAARDRERARPQGLGPLPGPAPGDRADRARGLPAAPGVDPQGRRALAGDARGNLALVDLETREVLWQLERATDLGTAAILDDGRLAIGRVGKVEVRDPQGQDLEQGAERLVGGGLVTAIAPLPGGFVAGTDRGAILRFADGADKPLWISMFGGEAVRSLSLDGARVLVGMRKGRLLSLTLDHGDTAWETEDVGGPQLVTCALPGGLVASGGTLGVLHLRRADDGEPAWPSFDGHQGVADALSFTPDGALLVSVATDGARGWREAGDALEAVWRSPMVYGLQASTGGGVVLSEELTRPIRARDPLEPVLRLHRPSAPPATLDLGDDLQRFAVSPDGRQGYAFFREPPRGMALNLESGGHLTRIHTLHDTVDAWAYALDGSQIALATGHGIQIEDLGEKTGGLSLDGVGAMALAFLTGPQDPPLLLVVQLGGGLQLRETYEGELVRRIECELGIAALCAAGGQRFLSLTGDGRVHAWDLARQDTPLAELSLEDPTDRGTALASNPASGRVAVSTGRGRVLLYAWEE